MKEIEKLDKIVEYLVTKQGRISFDEVSKIFHKIVPDNEAEYLCNVLLNDGYADPIIIPMYNRRVGISCTYATKKLFESGGYKKIHEIQEANKAEDEKIKSIKNSKLLSDAKLSKLQVRTFWPLFILALIGGICGIISLLLQIF